MIDVNIKKNPDFYFDYRQSYEFLKSLDYDKYHYQENIVNFHIFSEIKNEKELESVKSYFATQNLEKTKLILWSNYDITNNSLLKDFKDKIDFRVYDAIKEAKGTVLENKTERLLANDSKHYLQSDLLRLLVLHNYGGIWIDMDVILLKDFKPILDQEFMYQWGGDVNFSYDGCCATVLSLFKKSELSKMLLEELLAMPIHGGTTVWGKDLFARVYKKQKFTIFPSTFFNIEWLMSKVDVKLSEDILEMWFEKECPDNLLFLDCFAWHWHNSSNKNKKIIINSKFDKLRQLSEVKLKKEINI